MIDTQRLLQSEEYKSAAAPGELEKINEACTITSDWLYDEGFGQTADVYEEKLNFLKTLTSDLYERVYEHRERPEVLAGLQTMINGSNFFLGSMKTLSTGDNQIFTSVEIETLEKTINDTYEFQQMVIKNFEETKGYETVKYKVRDIANKMALLDREVKYLVNKAKIWKPKVEEKIPEASDNSTKEGETISEAEETGSVDTEEVVEEVEKNEERREDKEVKEEEKEEKKEEKEEKEEEKLVKEEVKEETKEKKEKKEEKEEKHAEL